MKCGDGLHVGVRAKTQQTRAYPYRLGAGSARPNPKMGARDPENPLFLVLSVLRGGLRPWSQTMVSEGASDHGVGVDPETVKNASVSSTSQDFHL